MSTGERSRIKSFVNELRGCGPFLHNDPQDRPEALFGARTRSLGREEPFLCAPAHHSPEEGLKLPRARSFFC